MQRILQFGRGSLIGLTRPLGIALQVDVDFADRFDVASGLVIGEVVAINLVVAVVILAVDHDVHVLQFGVPALLELHCL